MKRIDNDRIRENLRKFRRGAHMSQAEVAEKIGIHLSTYKHLESRGGTDIIHRGIEKLPEVFGVSPEELLCGEVSCSDMVSEDGASYGIRNDREYLEELGNELMKRGQEMSEIGKTILERLESLTIR